MVNAPRMHQERRANHLAVIEQSIKAVQETGKEINKKKLIIATMANLNLSRRTATDYVEMALFKLGIEL